MAAPCTVYTNLPRRALLALLALGTAKLMLLDTAYTPNQDTDEFVDDVVADEAAGTSYPAGGITLTGVTVLVDTATNTLTLDADNIATAGLSVSCQYGVICIDTGVDATSPLIAYLDLSEGLGGNVTVTALNWDADGIVPFVVA